MNCPALIIDTKQVQARAGQFLQMIKGSVKREEKECAGRGVRFRNGNAVVQGRI